jgi:hypothetical protein
LRFLVSWKNWVNQMMCMHKTLHQPSAKLPDADTCVAAIACTSCVARLATAAWRHTQTVNQYARWCWPVYKQLIFRSIFGFFLFFKCLSSSISTLFRVSILAAWALWIVKWIVSLLRAYIILFRHFCGRFIVHSSWIVNVWWIICELWAFFVNCYVLFCIGVGTRLFRRLLSSCVYNSVSTHLWSFYCAFFVNC